MLSSLIMPQARRKPAAKLARDISQLCFQVYQFQKTAAFRFGLAFSQCLIDFVDFLPQFREVRLLEELLVQSSHVFVHLSLIHI